MYMTRNDIRQTNTKVCYANYYPSVKLSLIGEAYLISFKKNSSKLSFTKINILNFAFINNGHWLKLPFSIISKM